MATALAVALAVSLVSGTFILTDTIGGSGGVARSSDLVVRSRRERLA